MSGKNKSKTQSKTKSLTNNDDTDGGTDSSDRIEKKKQKLNAKSIALPGGSTIVKKNSKRKADKDNNDDDEEEDDDDDDEDTDDSDDRDRDRSASGNNAAIQKGIVGNSDANNDRKKLSLFQTPSKNKTHSLVGQIPDEITYYIRSYMNILIGSVLIESERMKLNGQTNSLCAIPGIVANILNYNNVTFRTIKYCFTKILLCEPVWFHFDIEKNELILFIYEPLYDTLCSKITALPVTLSSGLLNLEKFNNSETIINNARSSTSLTTFLKTNDEFSTRSTHYRAIFNCAIVADHVAQHILYEIFNDSCVDRKNCNLHDNYNSVGTTLHSMFEISAVSKTKKTTEEKNYFTVINNGVVSANNRNISIQRGDTYNSNRLWQ